DVSQNPTTAGLQAEGRVSLELHEVVALRARARECGLVRSRWQSMCATRTCASRSGAPHTKLLGCCARKEPAGGRCDGPWAPETMSSRLVWESGMVSG